MDGGPPIVAPAHHPIDAPAPSIIEQDLVTQPVQTGILTIDALFVLGRGQRELLIGDRGTGKTAIAVDTGINQRPSDLICIYVAVGQKSSAVARIIDAICRHGARERCISVVVAATASPRPGMDRTLRRHDPGGVLSRQRTARPDRHRRSEQARRHAP